MARREIYSTMSDILGVIAVLIDLMQRRYATISVPLSSLRQIKSTVRKVSFGALVRIGLVRKGSPAFIVADPLRDLVPYKMTANPIDLETSHDQMAAGDCRRVGGR